MFVKVLHANGSQTMWQCFTAVYHPRNVEQDAELKVGDLHIGFSEGATQSHTMEIHCKKGVEIFFMNDNGRTIDRITF